MSSSAPATAPAHPGLVVAIDGPSGSGKSSTSRGVAARLGAALPRHRRDVPRDDLVDAARTASTSHDAGRRGRPLGEPRIVSGTDPRPRPSPSTASTSPSRSARDDVTGAVSPGQRRARGAGPAAASCSARSSPTPPPGGIVVEGRDIGSVVAPDAAGQGLPDRRRRRPAPRAAPPRRAAPTSRPPRPRCWPATGSTPAAPPRRSCMADGAVHIDTTPYTLDEVIDQVVALVEAVESRA